MSNTHNITAAIYGAQMVAVRVYFAVKKLYPYVRIVTFLVSDRAGNPSSIDGIPVIELSEFDQTDTLILIAAPDVHHEAIIAALKLRSFFNYRCLDSRTEAELLERFYGQERRFLPLRSNMEMGERSTAHTSLADSAGLFSDTPAVSVYMSKFYKDRPLKTVYTPPSWVHTIQAGSALTEVRIAEQCDNEGDNISAKNPNYSELTATYWIGKHAEEAYLGLYHYRRILDVTEEDWSRIFEHDIDVILPYPSMHLPNIEAHHRRYLREEDWDAMLLALRELAPAYADALPEIFSDQYLYNFNMLIAKKDIFRKYCDWMFPILARTEELSSPRGWERADRYIGYLGESLTTLFFLYHQKDYKIAHTGCFMLI